LLAGDDADAGLLPKGIVDLQDVGAGKTKDLFDPFLFERLDDRLPRVASRTHVSVHEPSSYEKHSEGTE
jgi:hypothetical protein